VSKEREGESFSTPCSIRREKEKALVLLGVQGKVLVFMVLGSGLTLCCVALHVKQFLPDLPAFVRPRVFVCVRVRVCCCVYVRECEREKSDWGGRERQMERENQRERARERESVEKRGVCVCARACVCTCVRAGVTL
jgi:hypothetical protein